MKAVDLARRTRYARQQRVPLSLHIGLLSARIQKAQPTSFSQAKQPNQDKGHAEVENRSETKGLEGQEGGGAGIPGNSGMSGTVAVNANVVECSMKITSLL